MSNEEMKAIWNEIEKIARADLEYIHSLPDEKRLNDKYLMQYDSFLASHFEISSVL